MGVRRREGGLCLRLGEPPPTPPNLSLPTAAAAVPSLTQLSYAAGEGVVKLFSRIDEWLETKHWFTLLLPQPFPDEVTQLGPRLSRVCCSTALTPCWCPLSLPLIRLSLTDSRATGAGQAHGQHQGAVHAGGAGAGRLLSLMGGQWTSDLSPEGLIRTLPPTSL